MFYSLSTSSSPEAENTPEFVVRMRKSVLGLFKASPRKIHAFGILGVVEPLLKPNGRMVTDFAAWVFLISNMNGYSDRRSIWRTIRPIDHLFPERSVTFGDAGCDRLQLPLPFPLETSFDDPGINVGDFGSECLNLLSKTARKVKRGETLLLLLIGHGSSNDTRFQFLLTTNDAGRLPAEAFLTKNQLERALGPCQGDILIVCNSCYSGLLMSERWTLLCSAGPDQTTDSLSQSGSEYARGSAFTACLVAQATHEHRVRVPLPEAEPRSDNPDSRMVALPPSAPSHSPGTQPSIIKPSNMSFQEFVDQIKDKNRLLDNSSNAFQIRRPNPMAPWMTILPLNFTVEALAQIGVKTESAEFVAHQRVMSIVEGLQKPLPHIEPPNPDPQSNAPLMRLITAMPDVGPEAFPIRELIYPIICANYRQHLADPQQYTSPFENRTNPGSLLQALQANHVLAVAIQQIPKVLGWCDVGDTVMPFIPWELKKWNFRPMIENGMCIDELPNYLRTHHFPGYVQYFPISSFNLNIVIHVIIFFRLKIVRDRNILQWLLERWVEAGKPEIKRPEWEELMKKVGIITEREAMR